MRTRTTLLLAFGIALQGSVASADIFGNANGSGEKLIRSFPSGAALWRTRTVIHEKGGKKYERGKYMIYGPAGAAGKTGELDGVQTLNNGRAFRVFIAKPGASADQFLLDGTTLKATHEGPYRALQRGTESYGTSINIDASHSHRIDSHYTSSASGSLSLHSHRISSDQTDSARLSLNVGSAIKEKSLALGFAPKSSAFTLHSLADGQRAERTPGHLYLDTPAAVYRIGQSGALYKMGERLPE